MRTVMPRDGRPSGKPQVRKLGMVALACVILLCVALVRGVGLSAGMGSSVGSHYLRGTMRPARARAHQWRDEDGALTFAIIADLDKQSLEAAGGWRSVMWLGKLLVDDAGKYSVSWTRQLELRNLLGEGSRGMELSELLLYEDKLYTVDDRTGVLYHVNIQDRRVTPKHIFTEGDGDSSKGFKSEWASVKDGLMYVGSFGKEFTGRNGEITSFSNNWIKVLDADLRLQNVDWTHVYNAMRKATGTEYPGYMIHEAVNWSPVRQRWVMLPRRVSTEPYTEEVDEKKGSNMVLMVNDDGSDVRISYATPLTPERGFSSFKFLPESQDNIVVALKSEERESTQTQGTYITVFDLRSGTVLLEETPVPSDMKFEGLEFLPVGWPL